VFLVGGCFAPETRRYDELDPKRPFSAESHHHKLMSHFTAHRLFTAPRVSWPGPCAICLLVLNAVTLLGFAFRDILLDATCHRWISRFVQGIGERSWRKSSCGPIASRHICLHHHNTHEIYQAHERPGSRRVQLYARPGSPSGYGSSAAEKHSSVRMSGECLQRYVRCE
jgi:hypothetical protein